jgi:predicted  nucleic acid-binding Zn-ribbon protein
VTKPTEDLLAARRLRSAELALDGARTRLAEAERELDELRTRVGGLERRLLDREAEFVAERRRLLGPDEQLRQAQLADAVRRRVEAEQALQAERTRAAELEALLRGDGVRDDCGGPERELGQALRRVTALEGELEFVRRHATELEHDVRHSVDVAWGWLEQLADRFQAAMSQVERLSSRGAVATPEAAPPAPDPLAPERLDAALSRLRASVPAESAPPRRRRFSRH